MPSKENVAEWQKKAAESNGTVIMVDTKFAEACDRLEKMRREHNAKVAELAKGETLLRDAQYSLLTDIRKDLEEKGDKDVWTKSIGFIEEALEKGVHVVHLIKEPRR